MQVQLFEDLPPSNPKRESKSTSLSAYDYYAGFSEKFVENILQKHHRNGLRVLDPWNGAGTTTNCANRMSISSSGVDLNPVMTILARASISANSLRILGNSLKTIEGNSSKVAISDNDPLLDWFSRKSVQTVRSFLASAFENNSGVLAPNRRISNETLPLILFCVFSHLKHAFKISARRGSNPTWIKKGNANHQIEISEDDLLNSVLNHLAMLRISAPPPGIQRKYLSPEIRTADSRNLPFLENSFDLVVTSPPYCTRIDYAVKTSIEYATAFGDNGFDELRRKLMGTTTVAPRIMGNLNLSPYCTRLLERIRSHGSKASHSYYYKNILQYFLGLDESIKEISRVLRRGADCYLVVQDSFYKDLLISLGEATQEICDLAGLKQVKTSSFQVSTNIANINTASRKYRTENSINEHVLHVRRR